MKTETYNGWTNYETWNVALWMDNEQGTYDYWRGRAEEIIEDSEADETFSKVERAALTLMEEIKDSHETALPELQSFAADLLNAAMSEVNWHEIAKHYVDEVAAEMPAESEGA